MYHGQIHSIFLTHYGIIYYFNFVKRMSANDSRYEGYTSSNDSAGVVRTDNSCEMSIVIPSNNYEIFI